MKNATERAEFIRGLRECADFFEAHPSVDVPYEQQIDIFVTDKAELAAIARVASWRKDWRDSWLTLRKSFGAYWKLNVNLDRQQICKKVVTGERIIPAVPASPERTVETFEWVCEEPSLLAEAGK